MIRDVFSGVLVSFGLYSALPLPQVEWKKNTMRYALGFLPLIGVLVGGIQFAWLMLAKHLGISGLLYAAGAVLLPVALTGGIHLDGFIDTCDALCSYGDREKRLQILKDPHVGAFGIIWIGMLLLIQLGLFAQLYETPKAAKLLLFGYALARALGGGMIVTQKCAKDSGLAKLFADSADKKIVAWSMVVWMLVCIVGMCMTTLVFGIISAIVVLTFYGYHRYHCRKVFGGITGDLCGMCITICETLVLVCAVIGGLTAG